MRARQQGSGNMTSGVPRRPDAVWRLRRSPLVRAALGWVTRVCIGMLAVVAIITLLFVWAFGHPLAWSVIGCLFALLPLAGLLLTVGVGLRAAVVAGPGRIGVRFLGRWRIVDLGQVRVVRLADQSFPGFGGFSRFGGGGFGGGGFGGGGFGAGGAIGSGGIGGHRGPGGPGGWSTTVSEGGSEGGGPGGRALVFEDDHGGRVEIGIDALDAGLVEVVREGLGPDAVIDPEAARALGRAAGTDAPRPPGGVSSPGATETTPEFDNGSSEPGCHRRP
ncbi:MAG: hypothetical protein P4L20_09265 [Acidimicrobiales bacterium]|nr:hypothetical protein [Acidimicrobiales bacterium]